jgi:predicted dinucleotide-binding enzyme
MTSMKIAILGTGMVGKAHAAKLASLGHDVFMGSRSADNGEVDAWAKELDRNVQTNTFADATSKGEVVFNATSGMHSLEALEQAGADNLKGKILIDIANPLDFSKGMPPTLSICNTTSLGEQIQEAFPGTKVVKALNTLNADLQVDPSKLAGEHDLFICGNDESAKVEVTQLLREWYGWKNILDLGDITAARGTEMLMPFWLRLYGTFGDANYNYHITR